MKDTIIFDLDDTLADMKTVLCDSLNEFTGLKLHWSQWNSFNLITTYKITENDFYDIIIENKILENLKPFKNTQRVLKQLKERDYNINIITSRNYHPLAKKLTSEWFEKNSIPFDRIDISGHGLKKSLFIPNSGAVLAVDDNIDNCIDIKNSMLVSSTHLMTMPWNLNSHMDRINDISEVISLIGELEYETD